MGKRTFTSPLGQWTAAATTGLSCLLSRTMSFNFLPYTATSFYSPDLSPFSSLGLQLVRACACVCVLACACACLCACAYWKCCGQKRFPSLCVWWIQDRKTRRAWQQEKTEAGTKVWTDASHNNNNEEDATSVTAFSKTGTVTEAAGQTATGRCCVNFVKYFDGKFLCVD